MTIVIDGTTGISPVTASGTSASVDGMTVGRGGGEVSTNTAVGASAFGGASNSGGYGVAVGANAGAANTTATGTTAVGWYAGAAITSGSNNVAVGANALYITTTGASNTAVGNSALGLNTTASNNTAVGYQAGYSNTTGSTLDAFGAYSLKSNTTGTDNCAFGTETMNKNTTGVSNAAFGRLGLFNNTTGSYNAAVGQQALFSNTTASNNTAVGYQAGYANTTGAYNVYFGRTAGTGATGSANTVVGANAGVSASFSGNGNVLIGTGAGETLTTGSSNTFVGGGTYGVVSGAGYAVTTGSKNTILGNYSGNQGGLNITTANNYIVLSDGDGNPYGQCNASFWKFGIGGTGSAYGGGSVSLNGSTASGYQPTIGGYGNGTAYWTVGTKGAIDGSTSTFLQCQNTGGGVYLNGASATSWTAVSDERVKENLVEITDAAAKVSTLRAVVGNYTWDDEKVRRPFLIAQDVQAVLPEAVTSAPHKDLGEELGVAYTDVIPLLVAAIKEQQAIITQLTERITALEGA